MAAPETVRRDVAACKMQGMIVQGRGGRDEPTGSARAAFRHCLESKGYVHLRREWYEGPFEGDVFAHRFAAN